jgi:hypothetical protein
MIIRKWPQIDLGASVYVEQGSPEQRAVFEFLSGRGFEVPSESGMPATFVPNLPVYLICRIPALPTDPMEVVQLIEDLFRHVGIMEKTVVNYSYCEALEIS